jgi:hypothetical protein
MVLFLAELKRIENHIVAGISMKRIEDKIVKYLEHKIRRN